jgi:hypothetical protein
MKIETVMQQSFSLKIWIMSEQNSNNNKLLFVYSELKTIHFETNTNTKLQV